MPASSKRIQWMKQLRVPAQLPVEMISTRDRLIAALAERPRTVAQLAADFRLSQPTMLEQVRRALRDGLIVEVHVPSDQRRFASERYYTSAVPMIRQHDRELLEPACRALADELVMALSEQRGDLLAAFATTHLARDGWTFSELWPYIQDLVFRLTLEQLDGLITPTTVPQHGLAWVEELTDSAHHGIDKQAMSEEDTA